MGMTTAKLPRPLPTPTPRNACRMAAYSCRKTQRFIQVRTQPATLETLPRSLILNGQVVAGMDASSKVQALQAGRLDIATVACQRLATR